MRYKMYNDVIKKLLIIIIMNISLVDNNFLNHFSPGLEEESNSIFYRRRRSSISNSTSSPLRNRRSLPMPHLLAKSRAMNRSIGFSHHPDPHFLESTGALEDISGGLFVTEDTSRGGVEIGGSTLRGTSDTDVVLTSEEAENKIELEFQLKGEN